MTKTSMTRRHALTVAGLGGIAASPVLASLALAQTPKQKRMHPRISKAIDEMEATKEFLKNSRQTFGGYKVKAMTALEAAIVDLKLALQYAEG